MILLATIHTHCNRKLIALGNMCYVLRCNKLLFIGIAYYSIVALYEIEVTIGSSIVRLMTLTKQILLKKRFRRVEYIFEKNYSLISRKK